MRFRILTNLGEKGKNLLALPDLPKDVFFFLVILTVALGAFAFGEIIRNDTAAKSELRLTSAGPLAGEGNVSAPKTATAGQTTDNTAQMEGKYVASKNGTTYHLPWCSGAKRIKDENKLWFSSKQEAEARGYHPAANCKGL